MFAYKSNRFHLLFLRLLTFLLVFTTCEWLAKSARRSSILLKCFAVNRALTLSWTESVPESRLLSYEYSQLVWADIVSMGDGWRGASLEIPKKPAGPCYFVSFSNDILVLRWDKNLRNRNLRRTLVLNDLFVVCLLNVWITLLYLGPIYWSLSRHCFDG